MVGWWCGLAMYCISGGVTYGSLRLCQSRNNWQCASAAAPHPPSHHPASLVPPSTNPFPPLLSPSPSLSLLQALEGVRMELIDAAYPLLHGEPPPGSCTQPTSAQPRCLCVLLPALAPHAASCCSAAAVSSSNSMHRFHAHSMHSPTSTPPDPCPALPPAPSPRALPCRRGGHHRCRGGMQGR